MNTVYNVSLALVALVSGQLLQAGPDGLDIASSQNVRLDMVFACGDDDALCLKARSKSNGDPAQEVRNITTANVMIYNDGFRGTKIGTETEADFTDIIYENIYIAKAGSPNTLFLTDEGLVRNVVYKNFYVEAASGFGVETRPFAGRTPTGNIADVTVSNLVANGTLTFSGYSPSTATTNSGAVNFRNRSGVLETDVANITGPNTSNITLTTNPVIVKEIIFPIEGSVHVLPGEVTVTADVFHETGQSMTVEFFANGTSIGTDSTAPYEIQWAAPEGSYELTITATDSALNTDSLLAARRFEVRSNPVFTSVEVRPGTLDIGPGLSRTFQARALDQYGDLLDPQPASWSWSVSGGGSVDSNGTVTASTTEGGPHTVTAQATVDSTTLSNNASFNVTSTLAITNLFVQSGDPYVWDTLQSGKLVYIDRSSTFGSIPALLQGKQYLRTANDDKNRSGIVASFEINLPLIVYIAVQGDFDTNQAWFSGYANTGVNLNGKDVYSKLHQPGQVILGRNGTSNMYHVIVNYPDTANADPVAQFSATPLSGQSPLVVNFDASSSSDADGTIVRYDWDFGDGTSLPDGGPTPQHTYTIDGNYTVGLTVTDNLDATGALTRSNYIFVGNEPPVAGFTFSPSLPSTGESISFDATGSNDPDGSIVRYDWDFGDGTVLLNAGATPVHSYAAEDVFTVVLTVTDNDGATNQASSAISTIPPGSVALIYHFDFEANGGTGTTVNDVSGFGVPANGTTYVNSTPTSFFTNTTPSPDGDYYGNFEASRSSLQFSIDKWNDDTNGVAGGSNALTIVLLVRDFDGINVDADGTNFFESGGNDFQFGFSGGQPNDAVPLHFKANDGTRQTTTATADLTNATSGDSNGWILLALSYSSDSDTANFYVGREFTSSSGWNLSLVESMNYVTSSIVDEGGPFKFGDNSFRDPDAKFDDLRVYNGVLSPAEIAAIGAAPPADPPRPKAILAEDLTDWLISVPSETGFTYRILTATSLDSDPSTWASTGEMQTGNGSILDFSLSKTTWPADPGRFFAVEVTAN